MINQIGADIKLLNKISRKIGFTETESKIILFLLVSLFVGIIINLIKNKNNDPNLLEFNYNKEDSLFYESAESATALDSIEKITEKRVESKLELSDFRTEKKEGIKGTNPYSASNKLNINEAGLNDLALLPGIGLRTAQNILDYRTKTGTFKDIDELLDVKGVGKSKFERIKSMITVK